MAELSRSQAKTNLGIMWLAFRSADLAHKAHRSKASCQMFGCDIIISSIISPFSRCRGLVLVQTQGSDEGVAGILGPRGPYPFLDERSGRDDTVDVPTRHEIGNQLDQRRGPETVAGVGSSSIRQRSMKCSWEAECSFSSDVRHSAMNSPGVVALVWHAIDSRVGGL